MKIEEIKFLEIKEISGNYLSLGHFKNKPIIININNLEVSRKVYKEEEKLYLEIKEEELKILSVIENHICNYVYKKNNITIDYKKFKEKTFNSVYKKDNIKMEVHKNCLLLEEDQQSKRKVIEVKDINKNNYINIKTHFIGIKFYEKKFEPVFLIRKIIKHIEDENISIFSIESESDKETEKEKSERYIENFLLNDSKITELIIQEYPKTEIEI
jgi:hypothetical protein